MSQNGTPTAALPDPEVRPKAKRRQFTAEYQKRILDEADACTTPTQRGALVRREGLYSSHLNSWRRQRDQGMVIQVVKDLVPTAGITMACQVLDLPRSSFYRAQRPVAPTVTAQDPERVPSPRALAATEKATVRAVLNSERFQDQAPREVYATLLDEDRYLCSWRTMYRILAENQPVRERRHQLQHPSYAKPELLATQPNQLWSWDGRPFGCLVNTSSDVTHHQG